MKDRSQHDSDTSHKTLSPRLNSQREQLIATARHCFLEKGLHGTSVSYIAAQAGLGPGQMYRLFKNKDDIIEAVVHDIVSGRVQQMVRDSRHLEKVAHFLQSQGSEDADRLREDALLMEVNAESLRNPRLKTILMQADNLMREEGKQLIGEVHPELSHQQTAQLMELVAVMTEGACYRRSFSTPRQELQGIEGLYLRLLNYAFEPVADEH